MKKLLSILGLITVVIATAIVVGMTKEVGKAAFSSSNKTAQNNEERLFQEFTKAAEQINKRGPIMVDKDTRWDRSTVGPGARITHFYSLPNYSYRDTDPELFRVNSKLDVKSGVCASQDSKTLLQYGATYAYVYSSKDGKEIARFEINKNDCN